MATIATEDALSRVFAALADVTRRDILSRLAGGPLTVGELAEPYAMSRPAVSQHLRVLETAGLLTRTVQAQWRRCELQEEGLTEASEWIARHAGDWSDRFDLLAEHLARQVADGQPVPPSPSTTDDPSTRDGARTPQSTTDSQSTTTHGTTDEGES